MKSINWVKFLIISLLFVCVLFISSSLVLSYYKPSIKKVLSVGIENSTQKLYRVEFDDIGINIFTGSLNVKNLRLVPNIAIYQDLKTKNKQPRYLFSLFIHKFNLSGINLYDLLKNKDLQIDEISLNNPDIILFNDKSNRFSADSSSSLRHPYEWIKEDLKSLKVDQIHLKNAKLELITDSLGNKKSNKLFLSYFKVKDLKIDSNAKNNFKRPFYSEDIRVSIKNFETPLKDSVNKLKFEEAILSTASSTIELYNLKIIPNASVEEFKAFNGYRKTRIDGYVKSAKLNGVDFKKLFYDQVLWGDEIKLEKVRLNISQNKLIELDPKKLVKFPPELLFNIKFPFHFADVYLSKSEINYSEIEAKSKHLWNISFNNLNANINNFGNDTNVLKNNSIAKVNIACDFNEKAKTNMSFTFNYLNPDMPFFVRGNISNYDLKNLNPILTKLSKIEVANCDLRSLKFSMQGTKKSMTANITMLYNNLRVRILEFNADDKKVKRNAWYSMLANTILLNNDNPLKGGKTTHARFSMDRKNDQSFFGFVWKSLFKGIKINVGLNDKLEQEISYRIGRLKEIKSYREQYKEGRKEKRFERRIRKEERKKLKQASSQIVTDENS